jgi:hypothetical protein
VWAPVHIVLSPQGDELSPRGSWGICVLALPEGLTMLGAALAIVVRASSNAGNITH